VFGYWEVGALLEQLALAPAPAVSGLAEWPFTLEMHDLRSRYERYKESRLSLTALGKAILMQAEDFSRHNPIHRWWGGTELTNDRLWRWDPILIAP
jgi:transposase InsO family protein